MADLLDVKVEMIKRLAIEDSYNPVIRNLARSITKDAKTNFGKVKALYLWVKKNIKYRRDPKNLDIYVRPIMALKVKRLDCEDITALLGSLALSLGLPVKFKVISQDGRVWSHIYPIINGIICDAAASIPFGTEVIYKKARIYKVGG